jgi:hypothetical protein
VLSSCTAPSSEFLKSLKSAGSSPCNEYSRLTPTAVLALLHNRSGGFGERPEALKMRQMVAAFASAAEQMRRNLTESGGKGGSEWGLWWRGGARGRWSGVGLHEAVGCFAVWLCAVLMAGCLSAPGLLTWR